MQIVYERCAGLDVHKKTVVVCAITPDAQGSRHKEWQTFSTMTPELRRMRDWLKEREVSHVAMESTASFWKPIFNILEGHVEVLVVNAQHLKTVPGRKIDTKDAEWIADLLQHGLLRASFVPPAAQRELRELTRYRTSLVEERSRIINRLQKTLEDTNIKLAAVASDMMGRSARDMLTALLAGEVDPVVLAELARRTAARHAFNQITPPDTLGEPDAPPPDDVLPPALSRVTKAYMSYLMNMDTDQQKQAQNTEKRLHGLGVSQGTYTGRARVVQSPADYEKVEVGDILVAPFTSSGYNVLLPLLGAIVTDGGGALSHTAIVAREFGIPAVVGTGDATRRIPDGARLLVDGTQGVVEIQAGAGQ